MIVSVSGNGKKPNSRNYNSHPRKENDMTDNKKPATRHCCCTSCGCEEDHLILNDGSESISLRCIECKEIFDIKVKLCRCSWCYQPELRKHQIIKDDAAQKVLQCVDCGRELFERKLRQVFPAVERRA